MSSLSNSAIIGVIVKRSCLPRNARLSKLNCMCQKEPLGAFFISVIDVNILPVNKNAGNIMGKGLTAIIYKTFQQIP